MPKNSQFETKHISELQNFFSLCEVQRAINKERVDSLYANIEKEYEETKNVLVVGCFTVAKVKEEYFLIDGQHRFACYERLWKTHGYDAEICINTIQLESQKKMTAVMDKINDTCPARIVQGEYIKTTEEIVKYFMDKYPGMIRLTNSGKCQRPHIHQNDFTNAVNKILEKGYSSSFAIQRIEDINKEMKTWAPERFKQNQKDTVPKIKKLLEKIKNKAEFYIGMQPELDVLYSIVGEKRFRKYSRNHISTALRHNVWVKYCGRVEEAKCLFCEKTITEKTCVMAHDYPHSKGGEATVENLYPCCGECNLENGLKTVEQILND
jgi:5-methylcytosine-specific restriction endonuclease McrA